MVIAEKEIKQNKLYNDITNIWLSDDKNKNCNKIIFHKSNDIFKYKGKEYIIDDYNIVIDYKKGEISFAKWLSQRTNKKIELFPRFNKPDGFKTADYKICHEYFDYKHTTGKSS